jgi:predicted ArsR family transcriptional regulator
MKWMRYAVSLGMWSGCEKMTGRSAKREEKTRRLILDALKKSDGLTISDMSRLLDIHYTTASKYLAVMEAQGIVVRRDIGMAKVFRVKEK